MNRDEFRTAVFKRDNHKCVVCGGEAVDAHHIMERRLFTKDDPIPFGYDISNGVSLCAEHHLQAESNELLPVDLRQYANINTLVLPEHLDHDEAYTKWGDVITEEGWMPGELFADESVQKIIKPTLHNYITRFKHPRTFHLPWSAQRTWDDKTLKDVDHFVGKEVVVTVKLDGENTSLYYDGLHARSLDYGSHPSRSIIKALWAHICYNIPLDMRVCGENMYGKHTIHYHNLDAWFYVHSVWQRSLCLSWDETIEWTQLLDLQMVPVLYRGIWNEKIIRNCYLEKYKDDPMEGYVVRLASQFEMKNFKYSVAKYVDKPISAANHWYHTKFIPNELGK